MARKLDMREDSKTFAGLAHLKKLGFRPRAILDIGAYDGVWARSVRNLFASAHILMIDALPEKEAVLTTVSGLILNSAVEISLLGNRERDTVEFHVVNAGPNQTGSSLYAENTLFPKQTRLVRQRTLDQVLLRHFHEFELIKIDAQGAELDILEGGQRALRYAEVVLLEVATLPYNAESPQFYDVIIKMKQFGYVVFDILDDLRLSDGSLFQCDMLFVKEGSRLRPRPPY
jgi:FkbM family methyltransferase